MTKRVAWLVVLVIVVAVLGVLLVLAQQDGSTKQVTVEDLYALLTTEDGRNRLDVLEEWVMDIDEEVDLIHSVAERMLQEQYGFFEAEEWTLEDLKFQLDTIEGMLRDVKNCLACP